MSKIYSIFSNFSNKVLNFAENFEKIPNKYPEIITIILFPLLAIFFGWFHEPWFDEAQAWQIAKNANYHDILFYLPHFEGHPPFWHLFLSFFAKHHFPYEITIKSVTFLFSYISVFLILFKSPFYRIIKVILPFTYFLFYTNTIIARPYCLIMVAFSLMAIYYFKKFEKPFVYMFGLILLSLIHPFLYIISSFLTFVWFIESLENKSIKSKKIFLAFLILGIFYILIFLTIFPSPDAYALNSRVLNSFSARLIYTFFILPLDCFISHICTNLTEELYELFELILGSMLGMIIWYFLYYFTKGKKYLFITFLIPYSIFAIFATKYFLYQHVTVIFGFFIFMCWIILDYPKQNKENINETVKNLFVLFVVISLFVNLYWNFKSCILDVFLGYSKGKNEAIFIKKHGLDNYKIMSEWYTDKDIDNPNLNGTWLAVAPYFEKNLFYNFNNGENEKNYVIHKALSKEETEQIYSKWEQNGLPDILAGNALAEKVFYDKFNKNDYLTVYSSNTNYISKGILLDEVINTISVKKDLAKKLNLKEVKPELKNYPFDIIRITSKIFYKIYEERYKRIEKRNEKKRNYYRGRAGGAQHSV